MLTVEASDDKEAAMRLLTFRTVNDLLSMEGGGESEGAAALAP